MMTAGWFQKIGWPILLTITVFSGCRGITSPVEFYTLTPLTATSEEKQTAQWREQIAVGVGPVEFPKIIDRPQIVTRIGQNKLDMDEFHRWGSTLQDEFLRVLTENLSILLKSDRVVAFPWEDYFEPSFRIYLEIHQFEGRLGESVSLDVTWTVTDREGRQVLLVQRTALKEPLTAADYETLVSAKSRSLADLSRAIAREIMLLQPKTASVKQ